MFRPGGSSGIVSVSFDWSEHMVDLSLVPSLKLLVMNWADYENLQSSYDFRSGIIIGA